MNSRANVVRGLGARPLLVMRIGIALTLILVILLSWTGHRVYRALGEARINSLQFEEIVRAGALDSHLTRFARLSAVTGDSAWAVQYRKNELAMDSVLRLFASAAEEIGAGGAPGLLRSANAELARLEHEVIRLGVGGQRDSALLLLSGNTYNERKEEFRRAEQEISNAFGRAVRREQDRSQRQVLLVAGGAGAGMLTLLGIWLAALGLVRTYVVEREHAQERERELAREQVARAAAERASRAKNEFMSRMSHELRTPLNAILGFGQLLEVDATVDDQESVQQILRAGRHLVALIDEVLDIAKIEAGHARLSVEPVVLGEVVRESLDLVRHQAAAAGVTLNPAPSLAEDVVVMADPQRLKQVMLNLLSNAIKFNRPGGTVTIHAETGGPDRVRIGVRDTGRGIPADRIHRLFQPFDRLDAERTGVQGTGLGLALSKGLVEAMAGRMGVESAAGEGTTFWIELSAGTPAPEAPVRALPSFAPPAPGGAQSHAVLFVEDNLANLRLMERVFALRPHVRLLTAMQGSLALELAREHAPDLILLDLDLPDISGREVLEALRRDPATRGIPVVIVSADAVPSQVQRLRAAGATDYLTKPFDIGRLIATIDEALAGPGDAVA